MRKKTSRSNGKRKSTAHPPSPPRGAAGDAASGTALTPRRPIRPVDRQKMLDWLRAKLDVKEMPKNLWWVEQGTVFSVKWPHAARQGFCSSEDARLFKAWAEHTGLHKEGDPEDHKRWKSNFRCAIHSLPNVEEITTKEGRKGPKAARVYRILAAAETKKAKQNSNRAKVSDDELKGEDSDSGVSCTVDSPDSLPLTVACLKVTGGVGCNIPDFPKLGVTCINANFMSGGCVRVKEEPPCPPSPAVTSLPSQLLALPGNSPPPWGPPSSSLPPSSPSSLSPPSSSSTFSFADLSLPAVPAIAAATTITTAEGQRLLSMEDMKPVGIMTVRTTAAAARGPRTPSGDAGCLRSLAAEDPAGAVAPWMVLEEGEEGVVVVEEEEGGGVPEGRIEEVTVDEGIELMCDLGDIETYELPNGGAVQILGNGAWGGKATILDISRNVPEPAVAMSNSAGDEEDYRYTSLDLQEHAMDTE